MMITISTGVLETLMYVLLGGGLALMLSFLYHYTKRKKDEQK